MNSIESLRFDFNTQISELGKIKNDKISDNYIFVGSGDSYVAGLMVEYVTDHKCVCYSASDLSNSRFNDDKTYCFVSVTGRTKANIAVARRATEAGVNTIAITMNQDSKLAQACKRIVALDLRSKKFPLAGFSTFTANVLTCLQIAGLKIPQKFDNWHNNGVKLSREFLDSKTHIDKLDDVTISILGNSILYPLAYYTSLKMTEFFGITAFAHKLEEFCHSPVFGIKKCHQLCILGQAEKPIAQKLQLLDLEVSYIELYNQDILSLLFESIFFVQNLMLLLAEKYGYTELNYLMMKNALKISSDIIYSK
ncbi:MAG TPA: SIS domain-containing protein [Nitrososphaeraceae archaeon]|nr:SIS domain-containing protein [Nitrososphaeraceae archaeon]